MREPLRAPGPFWASWGRSGVSSSRRAIRLDPDALFVEALMDHRDVGLNIRQVALHRGHAATELAQAPGEIVELRADRAHVLQQQVFGFRRLTSMCSAAVNVIDTDFVPSGLMIHPLS